MAPGIEVLHDENSFLLGKQLDREFLVSPVIAGDHAIAPDEVSRQMVADALISRVNEIDHDECDAGDEDSFFVADLGEVVRAYRLWNERLPNVHAHYAVKCNTDPMVVRLLGQMGCNFDCASKNEIDTVLGLGFDASRIVYANPCKTNSFIRHAREKDVNLTTVDNTVELGKLARFHPQCKVLIRIATDDESAQCRLSTKFGCTVECAIEELLPQSKALGLDVVGVAFHVGSGAKDFDSIYKSVRDLRQIFDAALDLGMQMSVLDIGGGFEPETFAESSLMVQYALDKYFPQHYAERHGIRFIAEPGRFMVANAFTLATHIIARRDLRRDGMEAMVYINDGVYGNMNCILFDHQHPVARVLKHSEQAYYGDNSARFAFSIWGPTCDGLDCVSTRLVLAANVQVGDWLYFDKLGAYTSAATTSFNGLGGRAHVKYVCSEASVDL